MLTTRAEYVVKEARWRYHRKWIWNQTIEQIRKWGCLREFSKDIIFALCKLLCKYNIHPHNLHLSLNHKAVIVKYSFFKDKDTILKEYRKRRKEYNENRNVDDRREYASGGQPDDNTGGDDSPFRTNIYVSEDFPSRVSKARYNLRPFLKRELQDNNRAYIRNDKLVINGDIFEYDADNKDLRQAFDDK